MSVDESDESDRRGSLDSCQDALDHIGRPTAVHVDSEHTDCPDSTADKQTKVQPNVQSRKVRTDRQAPCYLGRRVAKPLFSPRDASDSALMLTMCALQMFVLLLLLFTP